MHLLLAPAAITLPVRRCYISAAAASPVAVAAAAVDAAGDAPELLLDVDAAGLQSAMQWLSKYKLRRKLQLADVSQQYTVWTAFEGQLQAGGAGERLCCCSRLLVCLQNKCHGC
jgi:hypothetical protein